MTAPQRIQRKRASGWRKPANAICVTRGTPYGNPFTVRPDLAPGTKLPGGYFAVASVEEAVATFRDYAAALPGFLDMVRRNLRGKDLACWCALDRPCHADVLIELANAPVCEEVHA